MKDYTVIVDKSTVPVETGQWVSETVAAANPRDIPYDVASNPEFLSEGNAVKEFLTSLPGDEWGMIIWLWS